MEMHPLISIVWIILIVIILVSIRRILNEKYRNKSKEEAQIKLYSTSETPKAE